MKLLLPVLLPILVLSGAALGQGPLAPPAAPAPTQKSLQQIEPRIDLQAAVPAPGVTSDATRHYIISQPGSYYLSANLAVTKTGGIDINAANVSLDLNGFTVSSGGAGAQCGIQVEQTASACQVSNGRLEGGGSTSFYGLRCDSATNHTATDGVLRNLFAGGCSTGLTVGGSWLLDSCRAEGNSNCGVESFNNLTCVNCDASGNGFTGGFDCHGICMLTNCTATNNSGAGFGTGYGTFTNCSANLNSIGFFCSNDIAATNCSAIKSHQVGIICQGAGVLTNCMSNGNSGSGISCGAASALTNCAASRNLGDGISVGSESTITGASVAANGQAGYDVGQLCTVTNCSSTANQGDGFKVDLASSVIGCTAASNGSLSTAAAPRAGINVGSHVTVKNCTVDFNFTDGILATFDCVLTGNNISENSTSTAAIAGNAGIHVTGTANCIDGNSLTANGIYGINAEGNRNFIARNNARNNGQNYIIAAGNRVAQIVVPAVNNAAITGANSGSTDGYTAVDPWANFTY